jgi:type II secretion system protein N
MKLKPDKKIAGYTLFALTALIAFLYLRFPSEEMARYFVSSLSAAHPQAVLQLGAVKPTFPPGLKLEKVVLRSSDNPAAAFQADAMTVRPEYLSLLTGHDILLITANSCGGTLKGRFDNHQFLSLQKPVNAKVDLDGLNIEKSVYIKEQLGRQISGKMKGILSFSGSPQDALNGTGMFEFTLINGSYPLQENIMGLDRIDFKKVDAQLSLKNGILTINRLKLAGDRISGSLSGDITLNRQDFKGSQMNLTASLEMPGTGNRKISLALSGTIGKPVLKFI